MEKYITRNYGSYVRKSVLITKAATLSDIYVSNAIHMKDFDWIV